MVLLPFSLTFRVLGIGTCLRVCSDSMCCVWRMWVYSEEIVRRLRTGELWILITTDLLARGMDFKGVKLVVNYDFPQVRCGDEGWRQ